MKTVIVGGVAAGASTGARLRRLDESAKNGFDDVAFLAGGMMTFHGHHRTPLAVGLGGMPVVEHAEDELVQRPGALEHV